MAHAERADLSRASSERFYGALFVGDLDARGGTVAPFERNGFRTDTIQLNAGESLQIRLPRPMRIAGVMVTMGPRTGYMGVTLDGRSEVISCFDQHCYYQRMGARPVQPREASNITIIQGQAIPETPLLKGNKSSEPRIGGISHLFFETDWDAPEARRLCDLGERDTGVSTAKQVRG
jgi:hypothetical protein